MLSCRLRLMFFFCLVCFSLCINQSSAQPLTGNDFGWGPGAIDEVIDYDDLAVRQSIYCDSTFVLCGNSLYLLSHGYPYTARKVTDFPFQVLYVDEISWCEGGFDLASESGMYRYDLETGQLRSFSAYGLLSRFLQSRVVAAKGTFSYLGCSGGDSKSVLYKAEKVQKSPPAVASLRYENPVSMNGWGMEMNGVDVDELTRALRKVNVDPHSLPTFEDFGFDEEDYLRYEEKLEDDVRQLQERNSRYFEMDHGLALWNQDFYRSMISRFDTISPLVFFGAITNTRHRRSTLSTTFSVELYNEEDQKLTLSFHSSHVMVPYYLPWRIEIDSTTFETYNVELARQLIRLLPENSRRENSVESENVMMLECVAGYLEGLRR